MSEPAAGAEDEPGTEEAELGYEPARDQLIEMVRELEAGGLSLEQSLALWEKGERLANICEQHLGRARERVEAALSSVEEGAADTAGAENAGDETTDAS